MPAPSFRNPAKALFAILATALFLVATFGIPRLFQSKPQSSGDENPGARSEVEHNPLLSSAGFELAALEKAPRVILPKNDPDPPAVESLPEEVPASNGKVQTPEVQSANDVVDVEVPPADGVKTARQNEEEMPADDEDPGSGSSSSIPNGYMARALAHLESEIDAHTPVIPNVEAGDCIAIFFPFDSAQIGPRGQAQLSIVGASVMNQAEASIQVKGYSDSIGKAEYNQKLIAERVNSVVTFLGKVGVPQNQVEVLPVDAELAAGPYREQPGLTAPEGAQAERKVELALLYD